MTKPQLGPVLGVSCKGLASPFRNLVKRLENKFCSGLASRLLTGFPTEDSPLDIERFFSTLYQRYEERFVSGASALRSVTSPLEWSPESPALIAPGPGLDYEVRLAA